MKTVVSEMKNPLDGSNCRLDIVGKQDTERQVRAIETIQTRPREKNSWGRKGQNLSNLWDIQQSNKCVFGFLKGERVRQKLRKKIYWKT